MVFFLATYVVRLAKFANFAWPEELPFTPLAVEARQHYPNQYKAKLILLKFPKPAIRTYSIEFRERSHSQPFICSMAEIIASGIDCSG